MPGGRWDPQTRVAVIGVGVLVVTVGVLTTVRWRSDLGAAALVFGGLLVGLAGVAGGTVFGPREPAEVRIVSKDPAALPESPASQFPSPAMTPAVMATGTVLALEPAPTRAILPDEAALAVALSAGDTERAAVVLAQRLRAIAPTAVAYHEAVRAVVASVLDGTPLQPAADDCLQPILGPTPVPGLPVAIDVRAGGGANAAAVRQTYQALLTAEPAITAILVVVNPEPGLGFAKGSPAGALMELHEVAGRPVITVPWRIGEAPSAIAAGLAAACRRSVPLPRQACENPGDDATHWRQAADLHWQGKLHEAEQAYRAIVDSRTKALGREHADTLAARDQHATVLRDLDRLTEALVECDEVHKARLRSLGDEHPDVLTSRSHLASIYHQLGDLPRAEAEHGLVLAARTRLLGSGHPETLITRSNLAKVYQDLGDLDRAISEHEAVLRQRAELLGPEHRDTLMSRSLLASALHLAGRLPDAVAAHRAVLHGRLRLLGPAHLDTAVSRHRLGSVLQDLGQLEEAIAEYSAARAVYEALLGPSNPFTRAAASDLALAQRELNRE